MQERDRDVLEARRARQTGEWPRSSFLASLQGPTFEALLERSGLAHIKRGETLVREGDRDSGRVFLLISACVKVTALADSGSEALLAIRVGGDIVGELALIDDEPRSAPVTACRAEPSVAFVLDRAEFRDFLARYPDASLCLTKTVAKRLRWANRSRIEFGGCPVKVRAARVIVELVAAYGVQLPYNGTSIGTTLSQGEFASLIGAAQPSIQRALRELRDAGLIDTGYRTLAVIDMPGLRLVAGLPPDENASF